MKLIKPSFEIWEQLPSNCNGINKQIERVARVCYKSEDKITPNSANSFVEKLIKMQHFAMLEHGTVYLMVSIKDPDHDKVVNKYKNNPYSKVVEASRYAYITTNYRVIVENKWDLDLAMHGCEPNMFHRKRYTVHFICDIGVGREFTRHRVMSMAQESTRYCDYSKDKYDNQITYIIPDWLDIPEGQYDYWDGDWCDVNKMKIQLSCDNGNKGINTLLYALYHAEMSYKVLRNLDRTAQQARIVLPLATKAELVLTGFTDQWIHFFELRAKGITGAPHPQAKQLAEPLMEEFIKRGYIINNTKN